MACLPPLVTSTCDGGHLEPRVAAGLDGHRLPQLGEPAGRRVLVGPGVATGHLGRGHDVLGGGEVRLAGAEADDVLALGLEGLGLGVDRQGGRRVRPPRSAPRSVGRSWRRQGAAAAAGGAGFCRESHGAMIPYVTDTPDISIPAHLLPADGRFGSGPSKVRPEGVEALAAEAGRYLGTSHRQKTVKSVVGSLREGLSELFSLPDGYVVALGNGGTTSFWDAATFGLIERKSQHLTFGEFSSKFAAAAADAPHLDEPEIIASEVGTHPTPVARDDIDLYALTHNETSTGVMMPIVQAGAGRPRRPGGGGRHLGSRRAARRPRRSSTPTTSPPRSASAPTAGCGWPCSPRPPRTASPAIVASQALGAGLDGPGHRPRQLQARPDLQHPGAGHHLPLRQPGGLVQRAAGAWPSRPAGATGRRRSSTPGPRTPTSPPRS